MGRSPCCSKEGLNRGAWTAIEDKILTAYIKGHGEGNWRNLPKRAGLKRCGKSCRLRWLNYLRPDIKRGNISHDEEELIIRLHKLLGNRWSLIAGRLPGRTDNEIKNYWNTRLGKKAAAQTSSQPPRNSSISKCRVKKKSANESKVILIEPPTAAATRAQPIRTKALRCTKVLVPPFPIYMNSAAGYSSQLQAQQSQAMNNLKIDNGTDEELHVSYSCSSNFLNMVGCDEFQAENNGDTKRDYNYNNNLSMGSSDFSLPFDEPIFKEWATNNYLEDNVTIDLGSLPFLLDYEEWP